MFSTRCDSAWISSLDTKRRPFNRSFILENTQKSQGAGQVSRQGGEQWSCYFLSGIPSQWARWVQVHCHGATISLRSSSSQAVCASHFPSVVSKPRSKTSHWQSDQVEQTPYAQFLECQKKWISIGLMLLRTWRAFFGRGEDGVFHCVDWCFISGSQSYTHDSSPVMTLDRKLGSCLSFLQLGAHLYPVVSPVIVQETRNKLCCNSSHVQFIR